MKEGDTLDKTGEIRAFKGCGHAGGQDAGEHDHRAAQKGSREYK